MTEYPTQEQAREAASTMLISNGGKTHLVGRVYPRHAHGCTKGNGSTGSAWQCDCERRWAIDGRYAACGSTATNSNTSMRYASRPGVLVERNDQNGWAPTCAKCAKRDALAAEVRAILERPQRVREHHYPTEPEQAPVLEDVRECPGCEDAENAPHANDCARAVFEGHTAPEWEALAAKAEADRWESIDRCDTDGFLSQAALSSLASQYRHCADVARAGGTIVVDAPVLLATGQVIKGEWVMGEWGDSWRAWEAVDGQRWFHPSRANKPHVRKRNDAAKGLAMHSFRAPAERDQRTGHVVAADGDWQDLGLAYIVDYSAPVEVAR